MVSDREQRDKINARLGNFILFIVLVFAVLINGVQYPLFGRRPVVRKTSSLLHTGLRRGGAIRDRRHLYLNLAKFAPHTTIILPDDKFTKWNEIDLLYGLARTDKVIRKDYDCKTFAAKIDFTGYVVNSGKPKKNRGPGPYVIALREKYPEMLILLSRDGIWVFVDVSLIPENVLKELS